jgi:hypothetical protein
MSNTVMLNPIEQIDRLFKVDGYEGKLALSHIKYNADLDDDYDYQIIRQSSHDSTLLFTMQVIGEALKPLVRMESYYAKDLTDEEIKQVQSIEYTVGNIKLESEYGKVKTRVGEIPGVTDTVSIPVRCKYTFGK